MLAGWLRPKPTKKIGMFFSPASFEISFRFAVELVSRPSVKIIKDAGGSVVFAMAFSMESASRVLGWFPCQSSKKEWVVSFSLMRFKSFPKRYFFNGPFDSRAFKNPFGLSARIAFANSSLEGYFVSIFNVGSASVILPTRASALAISSA